MFQKKVVTPIVKKAWPTKAAEPKKPSFAKKKKPREPFNREYTRDVKFGNGDSETYVWIFTEYKSPSPEAPQMRLREEKFIMDGRDRSPMLSCAVAWEVEMEVRIDAYAAFQTHIAQVNE